jgi:hypothetical protein
MYLHYADFMPVDWHPQLKGETEGMKHLALAVILACVLSGVARAGEIPTSDRTGPNGAGSLVTPGEIPSGDAPAPQASSALLTIILTLITIGR